ncbi:MAG: oxidoreductase, partial [Acidobacteriota bacterium]
MLLFLSAVILCCFCGLASLLARSDGRAANVIGACGPLLGGLLGLIPAVSVLATGRSEAVQHAWNVPYGSFSVQIDALSAFFLLPTLFLSALAALYGVQYMKGRKPGAFWFFFNLLTASMAMLVSARNGVLFLVLWEVMSLSSFFLVTFENEDEAVRRAGWTYLVATHLGTAFLFVLFLLLGHQAGGAT